MGFKKKRKMITTHPEEKKEKTGIFSYCLDKDGGREQNFKILFLDKERKGIARKLRQKN